MFPASGHATPAAGLPIVHNPHYDVPDWDREHRFPMSKFTLLREYLLRETIIRPEQLRIPKMVDRAILQGVHVPEYIEAFVTGTLDRKALRRIGLPWTVALVRRTLTAAGGTLLAARLALQYGIACNSGGGTHHAFPDFGSGFCIFNDVSVAIRLLQQEGQVHRVLIVDLDVHQGVGTAWIHQNEPNVFTFSMHCQANFPFRKQQSDLDVPLEVGLGDEAYLKELGSRLPDLVAAFKPGLVMYNAGADPHRDDPLGKLCLTSEGLYQRDLFVFRTCARAGVPVASVIGGGYSTDVPALARRHAIVHQAASTVFREFHL